MAQRDREIHYELSDKKSCSHDKTQGNSTQERTLIKEQGELPINQMSLDLEELGG